MTQIGKNVAFSMLKRTPSSKKYTPAGCDKYQLYQRSWDHPSAVYSRNTIIILTLFRHCIYVWPHCGQATLLDRLLPQKIHNTTQSIAMRKKVKTILTMVTRWLIKMNNNDKQDPVSTIQKTTWTYHSSFLVWCGLGRGFNYGCDH